jgi:hypothetical protein
MGVMEKCVGVQTNKTYTYGTYFNMKQQFASNKIKVISQLISQYGLRIEDVIAWFFSEYCVKQYGVSWLPFDMLSKNEITKNRTAKLFNIEESVRKQYAIFLAEGEIKEDLVDLTPTPPIDQLLSHVPRKYAYLAENQTAQRILFLLFSDQSHVCYIDESKKGKNFVELVQSHSLRVSDFLNYQKDIIRYLIDNALLEEHESDKVLTFVDDVKISLLYEIYLFGSTSFVHANKKEQQALIKMESEQLIIFAKTLFTSHETDYLNFLLNNKCFDNSWAIRNRYQHGAPNYKDSQLYEFDNDIALLILVTYMVKIDDELILKNAN